MASTQHKTDKSNLPNREQESRLIEGIISKDSETRNAAFTEFYNKHYKYLYATAYRVLNNSHDAEDLVQKHLVEKLDKIIRTYLAGSQKALFRTYLTQTIRNRAIDLIRHNDRCVLTDDSYFFDRADSGDLISELQTRISLIRKVKKAIEELPETDRKLVTDYYLRRIKQNEIAQSYGTNQGTISRRLAAIRESLRLILEEDPEAYELLHGRVKIDVKCQDIPNMPKPHHDNGLVKLDCITGGIALGITREITLRDNDNI